MKHIEYVGKPDKVILFWILLHYMGGWLIFMVRGGASYLIVGTLMMACIPIFFIMVHVLNVQITNFFKYLLILNLISFTPYIWFVFNNKLVVLLHVIAVLILSTIYLLPKLIWLTTLVYLTGFIAFYRYIDMFEGSISIILLIGIIAMILSGLYVIYSVYQKKLAATQEIERQQNFERLKKQEHLATVGQIAASIAHDIRNPLTSVLGFVQLMQKDESRKSHQEYFQIIRSEISHMETLLREVLILSKSHTVDFNRWETINLSELLKRLIKLLEPDAIQNNIQIQFEYDEELFVEGSQDKFHQVFLNILRNSLEAVESNGEIHIELSKDDSNAIVLLTDTGPGMPDGVLKHIFTPFFTTKKNGTGLGLPICQSIIKSYGGTIIAKNSPGGGAQFTILLPIKPIKQDKK
jgi:signal transduction histidine kinase